MYACYCLQSPILILILMIENSGKHKKAAQFTRAKRSVYILNLTRYMAVRITAAGSTVVSEDGSHIQGLILIRTRFLTQRVVTNYFTC